MTLTYITVYAARYKEVIMKTYTIAHRHNGYMQHSYIVASSELTALAIASESFTRILNVMEYN